MSVKKVLLGTTALVAAGFVASAATADEMMAEPISANVGGHYFVALGGVSGDDGAGEPRDGMHSTLMAQDLQIVISGSTTLDNGMTVGLTAKLDSTKNSDISDGDTGIGHWDERSVTLGGAFGRLQLGSVESARQQTTTFAPNAASMMGINTPYFTFTGALARYNDGIGAEDALKIIYFTPTMNGFSVGVSYAPEDSGGSQYGGSSEDEGAYKNHVGVGATFSQDFAGGSVSLSAGYETYDAEVPSGMSCASIVGASDAVAANMGMAETLFYALNVKNAIVEKASSDADGVAGFNVDAEGTALSLTFADVVDDPTTDIGAYVANARKAWTGTDEDNPLLVTTTETVDDEEVTTVTGITDNLATNFAAGEFKTGNYIGASDAVAAVAGAPVSNNCEPETIQFGLSLSFGDFSVGGGWQETDHTDTTKRTVMDVGVGWSSGPMSLAAMYGLSNREAAGGDAEVTRYGVNGSYALGAGVSVQAQLDFGEDDAAGPKNPAKDYDWVQFMIGTSVNF